MFDMTQLTKRYFEMKLPDGTLLEVEPPRMKSLKMILSLSKIGDDLDDQALENVSEGLSLALSKNKQKKDISQQWISENMHIDDMMSLLTAYFEWVGEIKGSKN